MNQQVYIRGKQLHCSLGNKNDEIIRRVQAMDVAPVQLELDLIAVKYSRPYYRFFDYQLSPHMEIEKKFYQTLFDSVASAIQNANLSPAELAESALFFGSTSIDIPVYESLYKNAQNFRLGLLSRASPGYGNIISKVAREFNILGPCYTFTTACTSSANGILYADLLIKKNRIKRAIVIGYDFFNELGLYGFESLKLLSHSYYRPFDKNRDGVIMGEGCGVVVLEASKEKTGAFYICGASNSCDTYNVTTHNTDGSEISRVIQEAVANADMQLSDIDVIKAHATGSFNNDATESKGLLRAFQDVVPPVTALKPYVGHTVGACGVIELILMTESIQSGFVPATPGYSHYDEGLGIEPMVQELKMDKANVLLNYFGFGGNCTALVVSNR